MRHLQIVSCQLAKCSGERKTFPLPTHKQRVAMDECAKICFKLCPFTDRLTSTQYIEKRGSSFQYKEEVPRVTDETNVLSNSVGDNEHRQCTSTSRRRPTHALVHDVKRRQLISRESRRMVSLLLNFLKKCKKFWRLKPSLRAEFFGFG